MLIDTHAHLHHEGLGNRVDEVINNAKANGVEKIVNIGVNEADSKVAIKLAARYDNVWATVGLHPHDANHTEQAMAELKELAASPGVVAIGECGLDYFRSKTGRGEQEAAFRFQIELALEHNLPMVWHVRDAFDDFFEIISGYDGLRGIVHCFTSNRTNLEKAIERGFYVAFNGIMTFTKDEAQLEAAKACPVDRIVVETDCPFLAPAAYRGKVNEPAYLKSTAEFLANLRGESYDDFAAATSRNAELILGI